MPKFFESTAGTDPNFFISLKKETVRRASINEASRVEKAMAQYELQNKTQQK